MKSSVLDRNGVSTQIVSLVERLVDLIEWPTRRQAMGDVAMSLLGGKSRVAESVFGWSRRAVDLGIHEHQSGILCINDISARVKPKTEDKHPEYALRHTVSHGAAEPIGIESAHDLALHPRHGKSAARGVA